MKVSVPAIRVVNVKGVPAADRPGICYVGRKCAGWPFTRYGNPFRVKNQESNLPGSRHLRIDSVTEAVSKFRAWFAGRPECEGLLAELWEACGRGDKPLGCWCVTAEYDPAAPVVCHGQILAGFLAERVADGRLPAPEPERKPARKKKRPRVRNSG